jgi:hypothetical protein
VELEPKGDPPPPKKKTHARKKGKDKDPSWSILSPAANDELTAPERWTSKRGGRAG